MDFTENYMIIERVEQALDLIRPYLHADGGDVIFLELTSDFIVKVKLLGACENCPMSLQTMKLGVEQTIKRSVPEIREVIAMDSLYASGAVA